MKRFQFTLLLSFLFVLSLSAQIKFGAGLSLINSDIGVSAKTSIGINDKFDIGGMATHYFQDGANTTAIDVDLHYKVIGENGGFRLKGIAGLQFAIVDPETELGINLGALLEIPISDSMQIYLEPKYVIVSANEFVISAGVFF